MNRQEQFYESIKKEMTMTLATEADNKVTNEEIQMYFSILGAIEVEIPNIEI